MNGRAWLAPLTGVAFIVVLVVAFLIGGEPPDLDEGAAEAAEFYLDNEDSVFVGSLLQGIAAVLFVFFGGILRGYLRESEGGRGTLAAIAFAGSIMFAVGVAIDGTINIALADAADEIDPATAHGLLALWQNDFLPFAAGLLTFNIAIGISIIRFGLLPQWVGWAAIVLAIVGVTPAGFIGWAGTGILVVIISIMLSLRERSAPPPTPTAPTTP